MRLERITTWWLQVFLYYSSARRRGCCRTRSRAHVQVWVREGHLDVLILEPALLERRWPRFVRQKIVAFQAGITSIVGAGRRVVAP